MGAVGHGLGVRLCGDEVSERFGLPLQLGQRRSARQCGKLLCGGCRELLHLLVLAGTLNLAVAHRAAVVNREVVQQLPGLLGLVAGGRGGSPGGRSRPECEQRGYCQESPGAKRKHFHDV